MTSNFSSHAVATLPARHDNGGMPRKARPNPKPSRDRTYIREWRNKRRITLEKLADMLAVQTGLTLTDGQLSRIERGESPYTQDTLEALAKVLDVDTTDLLRVDPNRPDQPLREFLNLPPARQRLALRLVNAADDDKTGTEG